MGSITRTDQEFSAIGQGVGYSYRIEQNRGYHQKPPSRRRGIWRAFAAAAGRPRRGCGFRLRDQYGEDDKTEKGSTHISATPAEEILHGRLSDDDEQALLNQARNSGIPFMQLPVELPARLKSLIPYPLALEIRCAPVGRDHNRLTVAMADPTNRNAVRHLKEITGMIIFPVSCEPAVLDALLANGW